MISLDSLGDETSVAFTVEWSPTPFTYQGAVIGTGLPAGSVLTLNESQTTQGRLGVSISGTNAFAAGTRQLLRISLRTAISSIPGVYPIIFTSDVTPQSVVNAQGAILSTTYQPGVVAVAVIDFFRFLTIPNRTSTAGQVVPILVRLESQGDESSMSFTLNWNPQIFSFLSATPATAVPSGTNLALNTNLVAEGKLGVLLDSTNTYVAGSRGVLNVNLLVAATATAGTYPVTFSSLPTPQSVSNPNGVLLPTTYENGNVVIGPTNASVTVSGRVLDQTGRPLRGATVRLTAPDGVIRTVTTSSFGVYSFENVEAGKSYVIGASSKRYRFPARVVNVTDSLTSVDLIGQE